MTKIEMSWKCITGIFPCSNKTSLSPPPSVDRQLHANKSNRVSTNPRRSGGPLCPAGKLVDELGLKNSSVGKARVSEVHGNFIVNDGGATATEVLELIDRIKQAAKTKRGIELETEVQIVGESA